MEKKMTEDEAWQEIERKQQADKRKLPQLKAEQFIADNTVHELGNITLSMAYEFGYRAAMYAAEREKE
jgi:hypothetical protein